MMEAVDIFIMGGSCVIWEEERQGTGRLLPWPPPATHWPPRPAPSSVSPGKRYSPLGVLVSSNELELEDPNDLAKKLRLQDCF